MYTYVTERKQLGGFIADIQTNELAAVDTETTGLDCFTDTLLLLQVKLGEHIYIFDSRKLGDSVTKYIVQMLKDSNRLLVFHNAKFDVKFLYSKFGEMLTNVYDVMLAEIMINNGLDSGRDRYYSLAHLVNIYCNVQLNKDTREAFYKEKDPVITEEMLLYSAQDVQYLEDIRTKQLLKLAEQKQISVAEGIEMPLVAPLSSMEFNGVLLDVAQWQELLKEAYQNVDKLRIDLLDELIDKVLAFCEGKSALELCDILRIPVKKVGDRKLLSTITQLDFVREKIKELFNLNSNPQMLVVLRDFYGVPIDNTNETTLNKFALDFPIIDRLLKYREFSKKVQTYGEGYTSEIHPVTGRIHTEINQLGMVSGRMSSSKPNLQNIPRDQIYRKPFIARPGFKILAVDFSQEELRILSVVAKVKRMIDAFLHNIDLHLTTAMGLFHAEQSEIDKERRRKGKTLNFAVGYGSTEYGLWKNFGIPIEEGREYLRIFYGELYPEINPAKQVVMEYILKLGYSSTLSGRKRFFNIPVFFPGGEWERERVLASILREGFNHIIQGTGADILKKTLLDLYYKNPFGDKFRLLLQVYDEIVIEVADDIAEEAKNFVVETMLRNEAEYLRGVVPPEVDAKLNTYWEH